MQTIYSISKNYQAYDGDGQAHWCDSCILYHFFATKEGAENYVKELLVKEEAETMEQARKHATIDNASHYEGTINDLRKNIVHIYEGNNAHGEPTEFTKYEIIEMPLYE